MRILIDIGHPVHVHMFKNFIWQMQKKGHKFLIIARDRDCICELLDAYKIKYVKRAGYKGLFGKSLGMIAIDMKIISQALKFKPDIMIGEANPYIAQASWLLGKDSYIFDDTEHASLQLALMKPFAKKIITPYSYEKDYGKKQVRYHSFKELAYLHTNTFKPDPKVKTLLAKSGKYIILRFIAWDASHDVGKSTKSNRIEFVEALKDALKAGRKINDTRIYISCEGKLEPELEKYRLNIKAKDIHSAIYYSEMYIGEGATMASESAMLGTSAIYTNLLPLGYIKKLERYGLIYHITDPKTIIKKTLEILKKPKDAFTKKRELILKENIDMTEWMVKYFEKQ